MPTAFTEQARPSLPQRFVSSIDGADARNQDWSYEVVEPIGASGMGHVYRATDTRLGRDVVIKVLPGATLATTSGRWPVSTVRRGVWHQSIIPVSPRSMDIASEVRGSRGVAGVRAWVEHGRVRQQQKPVAIFCLFGNTPIEP